MNVCGLDVSAQELVVRVRRQERSVLGAVAR